MQSWSFADHYPLNVNLKKWFVNGFEEKYAILNYGLLKKIQEKTLRLV